MLQPPATPASHAPHRVRLAHPRLHHPADTPRLQVPTVRASHTPVCTTPPTLPRLQVDQRKKDSPSPAQNVRAFKRLLTRDWEELPLCFETSGKTGAGKSELLGYISSVHQMYKMSEGH